MLDTDHPSEVDERYRKTVLTFAGDSTASDDIHLEQLRRLLSRRSHIAAISGDFEHASLLYRQFRRNGATVRKMTDCLIEVIAIRAETPLLHLDSDFRELVKHTSLTAV